ncbi:hypothetical protein R2236_001506 [Cronobacter sakazakii]|uniref:hypothetical protein n=1 Tax=Cronobacter sakazakii TaxID=28141 RepID=UPI000CFC96D6|nr:hypothetical protein [Cronobacter sakazakii]ELQ6071184.1 hypothetical protein [Cronobacter sakazakii]ELY4372439.1 hypothetical protein [Cronobacter sakazakii]MBS4469415.1 hypothetical protein [Cronobacter sakazakii]MBS4469722.1 hypothetical protein [Cronobacter sakazakii]MBS4477593.1 hypothetical protein [Cronobacter sakazakii]
MKRFFSSLFTSSQKRTEREYAEKFACYEMQLSEYGCSLMNMPKALGDLAKIVAKKSLKECEVDSVLFRQKIEYHNFALTNALTHLAELDYAGQELIVRYCLRYELQPCIGSANAIEQIIPSAREMSCTFYQAVEAAAVAANMTVEEAFGIHKPL